MEFFRLKRLKATLVNGPLPARGTAQYLAAQGALWSLIVIPSPAEVPRDWTLLAYQRSPFLVSTIAIGVTAALRETDLLSAIWQLAGWSASESRRC